jgi:uncharacterized membrane protein
MGIFTTGAGIEMLLRWGHFLSGIAWIGMLYYFNFVQMEYFKEAEAAAKSDAIRKLVPRALWWFRWGAVATLATGIGIFAVRGGGMSVDIYVGALLGVLMFANVWLIIWPSQKIVIASAEQVAGGGAALPEAAEALAKAGLASRTNAMFSIPMLFFMGASAHYPHAFKVLALLAALAVILVAEFNAAYPAVKHIAAVKKLPPAVAEKAGKMGPMASIAGVIHCGLGLTVILFIILEVLT